GAHCCLPARPGTSSFLLQHRPPPSSPLFPYTTLFRSPASFAGPGLKVAQLATVWAPASSLTAGGLAAVKPGASLTGLTVIVKVRSEEHTSELQSRGHLVCRLLLEKKKIPRRQAVRWRD